MNKKIAKRTITKASLPQKPPPKKSDWKTLTKLLIVAIIITETVKTTVLASKDGNSISSLVWGLIGSILIALIYFLLGLCVAKGSNPKIKVLSEALLVISVLLFLFSIQQAFLDYHAVDSSMFKNSISFTPVSSMLITFLLILDILQMSILSKIITVIFFYLFICLHAVSKPELNVASTYLNTLFPLFYLIGLIIFKRQFMTETPTSQSYQNQKMLNLLDFVRESIFVYDKKGNIFLQNEFIFKSGQESKNQAPADIFRKIKDLTCVSEEKISEKVILNQSNSIEPFFSRSASELSGVESPKSKELKHIVINLDETSSPTLSFSHNLDALTKSLYLSVTRKEIDDKKVIRYRGTFQDDQKQTNYLEVRIHVLPKAVYPIVIVLRDITSQFLLEEQNACDKCRETMFGKLAHQVNSVVDNSLALVDMSLKNLKSNASVDELRKAFINANQQILTQIVVTIGDIMDFCSTRKVQLKFMYAPCDIRKAIQKAIKLFYFESQQRNIEIIFDIKKDPSTDFIATTDEKRLIQLLMRLLSNSIRYTKEGSIQVHVKAYPNSFKITVEDTGVGIPESVLEKIKEELRTYQFDSIKTLHSKAGKSQGLPIAQMLALGLGPKTVAGLSFKSDGSTGTSVWFIIENKADPNESPKAIDAQGQDSPLLQQQQPSFRLHSPTRPSKFKMTYDYEAQEETSFAELSEGVEANNPTHHCLETNSAKKIRENSSRRHQSLFVSQHNSGTTEVRKSKFAGREIKSGDLTDHWTEI